MRTYSIVLLFCFVCILPVSAEEGQKVDVSPDIGYADYNDGSVENKGYLWGDNTYIGDDGLKHPVEGEIDYANIDYLMDSALKQPHVKEKLSIGGLFHNEYVRYHDGSIKHKGYLSGFYSYVSYGLNHLVEGGVDYAKLDFRNSSFILKQWDTTLVYSNFSIANWKFRGGAHYINGNDSPTNDSWIGIVGADYYVFGKGDVGLDFYYSDYKNYTPQLAVYQLTPHWGYDILKSTKATLHSDMKLHFIGLKEDVGIANNKKKFASVEEKLSLYSGPWTFAAFGWIGEQTFAVRNDGFVVYNLAELHTGGFGGQVKYAFTESKKTDISFKFSDENFQDFSNKVPTDSLIFSLVLGISF